MKALSLALGNTRHIFPIMHVHLLLKNANLLDGPIRFKVAWHVLFMSVLQGESDKLGSPWKIRFEPVHSIARQLQQLWTSQVKETAAPKIQSL